MFGPNMPSSENCSPRLVGSTSPETVMNAKIIVMARAMAHICSAVITMVLLFGLVFLVFRRYFFLSLNHSFQ